MKMSHVYGLSLVGMVLCLGLETQARTVAWYRFEDQPLDTTAPAQVAVTNCAVTGELDAMPRTINDTTQDAPGSERSAYMPVYEASAPDLYSVYDPATQVFHANGGGMRFKSNGSNGGASQAGYLRVEDSETLRAITNITLEAFVKLPPASEDKITGSYARPILIKTYQAYQATWCMQVFESNLFHRATLIHTDGKTSIPAYGNGSKTARLDDNRWHHVAVVYNFGDHTVRSFVDYAQVNKTDMNANAVGFYHAQNGPLIVGANIQMNRRMNGWLDEVRISDEALAPEEFLRFKPQREVDADVIAHLTLDDGLADWFSARALPLNAATNALWTISVEKVASAADSTPADDVFGSTVISGAYASREFPNPGSLFVVTNGNSGGTTLIINDTKGEINHGSYTAEVVFKTTGQTSKHPTTQYQNSFCLFGSGYMKVLMNGENGRTLFRVADQKEVYVDRVDDGNWHHLAFVFDKAVSNVYAYVDYELKATLTGITNITTRTGGMRIGSDHVNWQNFSGWLDEVRVTRRALKPVEFLATGHPVGEIGVMADFENTLSANSNSTFVHDGLGSARSGGQEPTFSPMVPGRYIARDGAEMQDRVANTRSLRVDGGRMNWQECGPLETPNFTVEFFARLESTDKYANLLRLNRGTSVDGTPSWALWLSDEGEGKYWGFRTDMLQPDGTVVNDNTGPTFESTVCDHKWHHWAIQADYSSGTDTVFRIYRDYEQVFTRTNPGRLYFGDATCMLSIGGTSQNPAHIHGWFDEIRFTRAVLTPDRFQRVFPDWTCILVR